MAKVIDQAQLSQEMQREVTRKQQQILMRYKKRLDPKKMTELQKFVESGKQVGSSHFLKLSPLVQEVVVALNKSGIEVMAKHTKNPFKKFQLWLSRVMMDKLLAGPKKKKKKASKESAKVAGKKTTLKPGKKTSISTPKKVVEKKVIKK